MSTTNTSQHQQQPPRRGGGGRGSGGGGGRNSNVTTPGSSSSSTTTAQPGTTSNKEHPPRVGTTSTVGSKKHAGTNTNNSNNNTNKKDDSTTTTGRGNRNQQRGRGGNNNINNGTATNRQRGRGNNNGGGNQKETNNHHPTTVRTMSSSTTHPYPPGLEKDEDVLIAFMPFMKSNNIEATRIYEKYQSSNDQREFLKSARTFLSTEYLRTTTSATSTAPTTATSTMHNPLPPPEQQQQQQQQELPISMNHTTSTTIINNSNQSTVLPSLPPSTVPAPTMTPSHFVPNHPSFFGHHHHPHHPVLPPLPPPPPTINSTILNSSFFTDAAFREDHHSHNHNLAAFNNQNNHHHQHPLSHISSLQHDLRSSNLLRDNMSTAVVMMNPLDDNSNMRSIEKGLGDLLVSDDDPLAIHSLYPTSTSSNNSNNINNNMDSNDIWGGLSASNMTPPRPNNNNHNHNIFGNFAQLQQHHQLTPSTPWSSNVSSETPPPPTTVNLNLDVPPLSVTMSSAVSPAILNINDVIPICDPLPIDETILTPLLIDEQNNEEMVPQQPNQIKKEAPPPRRVWTHASEQPGSILVNNVSGLDTGIILSFGPREELTAHWSLPIQYIIQRDKEVKKNAGEPFQLKTALRGLSVGLFRRGCTENGSQSSIICKENAVHDYWHDPATDTLRGKIPFFSPRTPGNVLFRMFWENEPLYTLGMGPTLRVRVLENDFENSVRFILSNFKGRKASPTSLSSLHSLAAILETYLSRRYESAARTAYGCLQESRKVIDACFQEYTKTSAKLAELEEQLEEFKKEHPLIADEATSESKPNEALEDTDDTNNNASSIKAEISEKTRVVLSGRASCERKWRDSQLAFASILKIVLTNQSMGTLLRRDLIAKMRVEFELWCPLSEEFAVISNFGDTDKSSKARAWYEFLDQLPHNSPITPELFNTFTQARVKMQMRTLGFDVNTMPLEEILFPRRNQTNKNNNHNFPPSMDSGAVNVFNSLSEAMSTLYQNLNKDDEKVAHQREQIRLRTLKCVQECGAFPPGTDVAIFGSSANGFGSPQSDLDMCLQLPEGTTLSSDDTTGAIAMGKLAETMEKLNMKGVDTCRLSARVPIIRYHCPNPMATPKTTTTTTGDSAATAADDDEDLIECDLSMHNPLSVMNTFYLRTYSDITPVTRVLMSVIKKWAKARDINSPARHTLSSYGFTIMLLHFLTYHKRTGMGLIAPIAPPEGVSRGGGRNNNNAPPQNTTPLLPNLHWMDPTWLKNYKNSPYRELGSLPRQIIKHPLNDKSSVNTYFFRPKTQQEKATLQMLFPCNDLSISILLASFFRYYAYEFDYKRHVVSMHSTASRGVVEREVKAELDGWRNYSAGLAIEDPFEVDYDIAHVLRGGYYHRIRREFAMAYTKIADTASGRPTQWHTKGGDSIRNMTGTELIHWICETIVPTTSTTTTTTTTSTDKE